MILVLTDKNDIHANEVIAKLESAKQSVLRLNLDVHSLKKTTITYSNFTWFVKNSHCEFTSDQVTAVWNRKTYVELLLDEQSNTDHLFRIWKNEWNKTLLGFYASLRENYWLNYYRNSYRADNKFLQKEIANKLGFNIPATIISNNKKALLEFAKRHTNIVIKMLQQDFYKMPDGEFMGFYVNRITDEQLKKYSGAKENPIFLQKYIKKDFEVRYTVVGEEHFICKIESQKSAVANIDWRRYDLPNTPHSIISPPSSIKEKVILMMKELSLSYAALDFIVDQSGEWYFLEINPNGQYLWIEDLTGLEISLAIANLLIKNS